MAATVDLTTEEPPRPRLVQLSYTEIASGADHSSAIAAAYGYGRSSNLNPNPSPHPNLNSCSDENRTRPGGLGILTVTDVPGLRAARKALLPLGAVSIGAGHLWPRLHPLAAAATSLLQLQLPLPSYSPQLLPTPTTRSLSYTPL